MSLVKNIKKLIPYYRFTDHEFKKVIIMLSLLKVFGLGWISLGLLLIQPGWSGLPLLLMHQFLMGFVRQALLLSPARATSDVIWWHPAARP